VNKLAGFCENTAPIWSECSSIRSLPGQLLGFGADPDNRTLPHLYDSLIEKWVVADPQLVPEGILKGNVSGPASPARSRLVVYPGPGDVLPPGDGVAQGVPSVDPSSTKMISSSSAPMVWESTESTLVTICSPR
jgi:hypothetical protein